MKNIYLAQINNSYGNNAFLPYSVGLLWSYAILDERIKNNYDLKDVLFLRSSINEIVDSLIKPDIVALSCYIWNWSYNNHLAIAIKNRWPNSLIIMGGPEVPNDSDDFFKSHSHIDVLVHGEGEIIFKNILIELLHHTPNLKNVHGISFPDRTFNTIKTPAADRISDLELIPSPYLSGLFDQTVQQYSHISFNASQETHRGCPYSCTFCDWGSAVMTKVRQFETDRILYEIEWFGKNKIDLLYNCDANYGILKRDIELTKNMIQIKEKYNGYPNKFRAAYAKKSNDKVFEIAKLLNDADMNKGITLSMQSMDTETLKNVKRSNIKIDDFAKLIATYRSNSIPTYTEIIVGLPGETVHSLIQGLDEILKAGQHDNISVYMCMLLKNSEMANKTYMKEHGIITKRVPLLSLHGTPSEMEIVEMNDIVVSTNTMSYNDWKKANVITWMIQCLHCLGLTQVIAMDYNRSNNSFMKFYLNLYDNFKNTDTVLGNQIKWIYDQLESVFEKSMNWDLVDSRFGDISWPLEEYSFLQILSNIDQFYIEVKDYIKTYNHNDYIDELVDFQYNVLIKPTDTDDIVKTYNYDLYSLYKNMILNLDCDIEYKFCKINFTYPQYFTDQIKYARNVVWYGRKAGKTKKNLLNYDEIY